MYRRVDESPPPPIVLLSGPRKHGTSAVRIIYHPRDLAKNHPAKLGDDRGNGPENDRTSAASHVVACLANSVCT